eukprot:14948817-Ditylum_brightwellii.AAC.1
MVLVLYYTSMNTQELFRHDVMVKLWTDSKKASVCGQGAICIEEILDVLQDSTIQRQINGSSLKNTVENCADADNDLGINMPKVMQPPQKLLLKEGMLSDMEHNKYFGNQIGLKINHPDKDFVIENCFKGNGSGFKTSDNPGFASHIDSMDTRADKRYQCMTLMWQVVPKGDK